MKNRTTKIIFVLTNIVLFMIGCTEDSPTQQDDDPILQDTIPISMSQEHVPWPSLADSPWPMYSHDPQGTRRTSYEGPVAGTINWRTELGGVGDNYGNSSIAIGADSSIYFVSNNDTLVGSGQHRWVLYALSPNGEQKWVFSENDHPSDQASGGPIITANNQIVFFGKSSLFANIYALNSDGVLSWKYTHTGADWIPDNLNIGMDGTIYFIDSSGNLVALQEDGNLSWIKESTQSFKANEHWCLAIAPDGNTLYVPGAKNYAELYAIDLNGQVLWEFNLGGDEHTMGQPMVDNQGNIYVAVSDWVDGVASEANGLHALNPDGSLRWSYNVDTGSDRYSLGSNGHLYICAGDELLALGYDGTEIYRSSLLAYQYSVIAMDAAGVLYIPGHEFQAIESSTGTALWNIELPSGGWAGGAIGYNNHFIYAYANSNSDKYVLGIE